MAKKRRAKARKTVGETREAREERHKYRVLTANAIFGDEFKVTEGKDGEKTVVMTPSEARKHTDADVRLQQVE